MSQMRRDSPYSSFFSSSLLKRSLAVGSGSVLLANGLIEIALAQVIPVPAPPPSGQSIPDSYGQLPPPPAPPAQPQASSAPEWSQTSADAYQAEQNLIQQMASGRDATSPAQTAVTPSPRPIFEPPSAIATQPRQPQPQPVETAAQSAVARHTSPMAPDSPTEQISQSRPAPSASSTPPNPMLLAATNQTTDISLGLLADSQLNAAESTVLAQALDQSGFSPTGQSAQNLSSPTTLQNSTLTQPSFQLQGAYLLQDDEGSGRVRLTADYPLTPRLRLGGSLDATSGTAFNDSEGLNINELYLATSLADLPSLRLVMGQIDLTSYFDRNSFAKDSATHFFNPIFQTNPALSAANVGSRPGVLLNWSVTDSIEAKVAAFSSSDSLNDFSLDGVAGEVGFRYGNAIIRGTYASSRDGGRQDGFQEIFQFARGDGESGVLSEDREEAYGINAEVYLPDIKMGLFGRYGRYDNLDLGEGGNTYSLGLTFLDLFAPDDRLGFAYGRNLSNDELRQASGDDAPDAVELFYDFRFSPNLRIGLSAQQRNGFSEAVFGLRLRSDLNILQ